MGFTVLEVSKESYEKAREREGRESKYVEVAEFVRAIEDGKTVGMNANELLEAFSEVDSNGKTLDVLKQVRAYIGKIGSKDYGIGRVFRFAEYMENGTQILAIYKTTEAERTELKRKAAEREAQSAEANVS